MESILSAISETSDNSAAAEHHQQPTGGSAEPEPEPQPPPPLSDEDAITMHVTTLLSVENDPTRVTKSMGLLRVLLSSTSKTTILTSQNDHNNDNKDSSNINAVDQNRKTALRRGAHVAVVYAMRRNLRHWQIQNDGCGIFVSLCRCKLDSSNSSASVKRDIMAQVFFDAQQ